MAFLNRVQLLNSEKLRDNGYVLYWMQSSARTELNHALEYAIRTANRLNRPLITFFGVSSNYPEANLRHFHFMIQGLQEVKTNLEKKSIPLIVKKSAPLEGILELSRDAALVVTDRGYTQRLLAWRRELSRKLKCPFMQVESDIIVPVESASIKEEYAARTIRPKIKKQLETYLKPFESSEVEKEYKKEVNSSDISNLEAFLSGLKIDRSVKPVIHYKAGTSNAKARLIRFLDEKLDEYPDKRNDPSENFQSNLSPYLHFGQISPLEIAFMVKKTESPGVEAFLEELIVRRELAINYVTYNPDHGSFSGLPNWAKKTLIEHRDDSRVIQYSLKELEEAETHDPYWNAAQNEMMKTGKMHGYMRMYWGKKILEWTQNPQDGFNIALYLNNKYELDGRDPNSYAGVAWCFGKHDRPWKERRIFGKIRYMNSKGLERKFNIGQYVKNVNRL
jgi:deoxyribodipyrimidine photo-lyase